MNSRTEMQQYFKGLQAEKEEQDKQAIVQMLNEKYNGKTNFGVFPKRDLNRMANAILKGLKEKENLDNIIIKSVEVVV